MTESTTAPDVLFHGGRLWTQDPDRPWAQALAVTGGRISAVGQDADLRPTAGPRTRVVDLGGRFVVPGLVDGHIHLNLGGSQARWEMPVSPDADLEAVLETVRAWARDLPQDAWVIGGIVNSAVLEAADADAAVVARLDEAAGGRPVLLRDVSMHNRWVNSAALEAMGVRQDSADPDGGHFGRTPDGSLSGVLEEMASALAEDAFAQAVPDPAARTLGSIEEAVRVVNSFGITSVQDAATTPAPVEALRTLEDEGRLTLRIVTSAPVRPFLEASVVGDELVAELRRHRSELVRPDFVKVVLDGVPMTRTTALLAPYRCHHHGDEPEYGELYWEQEDLVEQVAHCYDLGVGAKFHATGDASVRAVLDAVETVRRERGPGPLFQIAHAEYVDPVDLPRFAALDVVADASPYIWYPGVVQDAVAGQISEELYDASWPVRDLVESGAVVAAGSDWPCVLPTPDPWTGLQTLVTRRNIDPAVPGALNPGQAVDVATALTAFTSAPADAAGLGGEAGRLRPGLSADFAVLDRNLFEVPVEEIHRTVVLQTWFRGDLAYEAVTPDAAGTGGADRVRQDVG
ncbi:amidohydrolase [Kineococcus sp. LSe6-4]|uniref:Amidohydrolase n=1 Tax=Kineococcus halophytocola TaxID=3234027 RepID=A0ABV4GYH8_9ACTN